MEEFKSFPRQRLQCGSFDFHKDLANLLLGRAMDPCIRHGRFPLQQMLVLRFHAAELTGLQPVSLDVADAAFDFSLVTGHPRLGGKYDGAVVLAE
jgi:hypothetical protein